MKNKILSCLMAFTLCFTIIINSNNFRKDTYAVVAVLPVAIPVGEAVVTIGSAAVVALAGILAGMGISSSSASDTSDLVEDWIRYDIDTNGWKHTKSILEQTGFTYEEYTEPTADGTIGVIDVPDYKAGTFTKNPDGTYSNLQWFQKEQLSGGSASEPDNNNLGKRLVAGFMAGIAGLSAIGSSFYDYLHNSDDVEYIAPVSSYIGNLSGIKSDLNSLYIIRAKQLFDKDITDNFCSANKFTGWEYYDLYYGGPYADGSKTWYASYVLGYNQSDNSCRLYTGGFIYYSDSSLTRWKLYARGAQTRPEVFDIAYSISSGSGYTVKLSQLKRIRHYVNTDVLTEQSSDIDYVAEQASLKIGDSVYSLKQNDNIYDNQEQLKTKVESIADSNGQVIVSAPAYDTAGNTVVESYTEPTALTEPIISTALSSSTAIDEGIQQSDSVLDVLKRFIANFFPRIEQAILNAIKTAFVPADGYFENKINELREKHCSSAGTIHFDELEIPDVTWNTSNSRWGSELGTIVIVDNSYLRNNIDSFRSLLAGFIYFVWLFHEAYRMLKILNVVSIPKE